MFKKLGGTAAIEGVVDEFYSRVFVDDEVKGFFEGIDKKRLESHQVFSQLYYQCITAAKGIYCSCTVQPCCPEQMSS